MQVSVSSSSPVIDTVTLTMSKAEAEKLRRAAYYNKTVGKKFAQNWNHGGSRKGADLDSFLGDLGNKLKAKGINRF